MDTVISSTDLCPTGSDETYDRRICARGDEEVGTEHSLYLPRLWAAAVTPFYAFCNRGTMAAVTSPGDRSSFINVDIIPYLGEPCFL